MDCRVFSEIVTATHACVRSYVARKVPPDDVDDIVQETYTSLWKKDLPDPVDEEDRQRLRGLVFCIAEHRVADMWRAQERRQRRTEALAREPVDHATPSSLDVLLRASRPSWLDDLPGGALDVLLPFAEGVPVTVIATDLGISANAVSSRLKRIRARVAAAPPDEVATAT